MAWITDSLRGAIEACGRLNPFQRQSASTGIAGVFTHQLALAAYMSSGLMRRVIAIPAADRTQKWRDWQADKEDITLIEAEEKRLALAAKTREAEVLRGTGGGAFVIVTAGEHATPLTPEMIAQGGIVAINVVSRWEITPCGFDKFLSSPNYKMPSYFEIDSGTGEKQRIDRSRVICFRGDRVPVGTAIDEVEAFWGDSRLLQIFQAVQNSDHTQEWFVELVKKAKLLRIGIPDLDSYPTEQLNKRIALIAQGENSLNATVYRSGAGAEDPGEKIDDYQITWAGIPAFMDAIDQRLAAVSGIPFTKIMGRSPAGMNATGEHDMNNWWDVVGDGQENEVRPCLAALDPFLLRSAGVSKPDEIWWIWAPLRKPTEKEEAETFGLLMDAIVKMVDAGMAPREAVAEAVQNLIEERGYMPGLADALKKIPEDERFGLNPEDDGTDPSAIQAREEVDPNLAGSGGGRGSAPLARRAANDAWMLEDWAPKTLYVRRDVLNRADIVKWAESQGFTDIVPDLHVTITYSTTPVDWMAMGESWRGKLEIEAGGPRLVEPLGPDGKYKALLFTAYELVSRNQEMRDKGASFSWAEYQPHISIQIGGDIDLASVKPYTGKIVLGHEIFEEIRA